MKQFRKIFYALSIGAVGFGIAIAGITVFDQWPISTQLSAATPTSVQVKEDASPINSNPKIATSYADVVEKAAPSVVSIFTTRTIETRQIMPNPFLNDPFFQRFFGGREGLDVEPRERTVRNLGSGVIVTENGYIITNHHVVEGADEIKVALAKGKQKYDAEVVGKDPNTDIAVLKIKENGLQAITFTDSNNLNVGDIVLAMGNPFGIGQTVTLGIVSAVGRGGMGIEDYEDFIQTDAAINPGNSGGALIDAKGRLVGLNTAIISRTGGYQGVGFAIPANLAKHVMEQLIEKGRVERGYLGVTIQDLTPELAEQFNAPSLEGALIGGIQEDSAAEEAGLKPGDVIIEVNGKQVTGSRKLKLLIGSMNPDEEIEVKALRNGEEKDFTVKLKLRPQELFAATQRPAPGEGGGAMSALAGVELHDLTPQLRSQLDVPENIQGPVVTNIRMNTPAYKGGLRQGDIIQQVGQTEVSNTSELRNALSKVNKDTVLFLAWNSGGSRFVVIKLNNE